MAGDRPARLCIAPLGGPGRGNHFSPGGPVYPEDGTTGEWLVKGPGGLSKKRLNSMATGIADKAGFTAGGLMVVGKSKSDRCDSEAFEWTGNPMVEDGGTDYLYDLEYILNKTGAGKLSGMKSERILNEATGVSAAGDRIVGCGVNPEHNVGAWVAKCVLSDWQ